MNVAVAGVPKTIDNDVDIIDRSFGFLTSVEVSLYMLRYYLVSITALYGIFSRVMWHGCVSVCVYSYLLCFVR